MSRSNDGLPMLPPWLSEGDANPSGDSSHVGYEAPVQNLPQDDYIPDSPPPRRGFFNRGSDDDSEGGGRRDKRRLLRRRNKSDQQSLEERVGELLPNRANSPARRAAATWDEWSPRSDAAPERPQGVEPDPADHMPGGTGRPSEQQPASPGPWQSAPPPQGEQSGFAPEAVQQYQGGPNAQSGTDTGPGAGQWSAPQPDLPDLPTRRPGPPSDGFRPIGDRPPVDPNQYGSPPDSAQNAAAEPARPVQNAPGQAPPDIPPTTAQQEDNRPYLPPPPPLPDAPPSDFRQAGETAGADPAYAPTPEPARSPVPEPSDRRPAEPTVVQQPLQRLPDLPAASSAAESPTRADGPEAPEQAGSRTPDAGPVTRTDEASFSGHGHPDGPLPPNADHSATGASHGGRSPMGFPEPTPHNRGTTTPTDRPYETTSPAGPSDIAPQSGYGPSNGPGIAPAPGTRTPPGPAAPGPAPQAPGPVYPASPTPGPAPYAPGPAPYAPGPGPYASGPVPQAPGPTPYPPGPAPQAYGPTPYASGPYAQAPGPDPRTSGFFHQVPDPYRQWPAPQPGPNHPAPMADSGPPVQGYQPPPNQQWNQPAPPPHGGQWQGPPQGQPGYWPNQNGPGGPVPGGPGSSLDDVPLRRAKRAPGSGWRKAVHHVSRGAINPGMSAEERRLQELVARIRQPVRGDYRIAVLSLKGGVGKTTTTMGLGSTFSSIRGDRVIAVDANPDFGTLSQRVPLQTRSTVRDLLLDPAIQRYSDVRRHTSQSSSRLEVLASERDPAASEAFNEAEYRAVARILQRFYNIILTDCGTGLMHSAMTGVLDLAHSLVLISSPAIDGARSAAATLDWLSLHGHDHLVRNAVVVINCPRDGSPNVGIQQLREYFLTRCRAVHIIPFDTHLSEGAEIDLHRLHKDTKRAYVELAATVADDFATDHRRFQQ